MTATDIRTEQNPPAARRRRTLAAAALSVAALATAGVLAGGASRAEAAVATNCAANPVACGYPGAATTGVPSGTTLKTVPSQVSSGPGWSYNAADGEVIVTGKGATLTGLYIPYTLVINASNVTVNDVQVVTAASFGIALTHTAGVTIENSTISGTNSTSGHVGSAIDDEYGDSTALVIKNNNISAFKTAIQVSAGLIQANYIHDPGYVSGDHTNGIYVNGGTAALTITGNTIFNDLSQTDAINLDAGTAGVAVANKTVTNNFLAGGSYTIYGGAALSAPTSNIVITGNRFGQQYYTTSGQYGPAAYYTPTAPGNTWTGNIWDTTGTTIPS